MLNAKEYSIICEEHGVDNVIIVDDYQNQHLIVKIKHDCGLIHNDDWKLSRNLEWTVDALEFKAENNDLLSALSRGEIPQIIYNEELTGMHRNVITRQFNMWGVVDLTWTEELAKELIGLKCLEIAGGKGWLSKALDSHGVDIVCTDIDSSRAHHNTSDYNTIEVFDVESISSSDAIDKYCESADVLVCSWPPYTSDGDGILALAIKQLNNLQNSTIKKIVYIGEGDGGCTDSSSLWDLIEIDQIINIPQWNYIHDRCYTMDIV